MAYNFASRLITLKGLMPDEYIRKKWTEKEQTMFTLTHSSTGSG
jgi:hypothetical protein